MSKTGIALDKTFSAINGVANAFNDLKEKITEAPRAVVATIGFTALTGVGMASPAMAKPAGVEAPAPAGHANEKHTDTKAEKAVKLAKAENVKILVAKGSSKEAAVAVVNQETEVFFGGDRGEIIGQRPDGACIIATQEGKTVEEFTKTELAVGQTPEQAKKALMDGLCNGENGVNVPTVASFMAQIEAMKNNIDINDRANFDKVYTEMVQKYVDAMQESPDAAQAYLQTVQDFFKEATFGEVSDRSGMNDHSIYTHGEGDNLEIVAVNVINHEGATGVTGTFTVKNLQGVTVTQPITIGKCGQVRIGNQIVKVTPETPVAHPAKPVKPTAPAKPARPVVKPPVTVPSTSTTAAPTTTEAPTTTAPSNTTIIVTTTGQVITTTTKPNTSTTEATTTTEAHPPKTCENNPEVCVTTTVEDTAPDTTADTRPHPTVAGSSENSTTSTTILAQAAGFIGVGGEGSGNHAVWYVPTLTGVAAIALAKRRMKLAEEAAKRSRVQV